MDMHGVIYLYKLLKKINVIYIYIIYYPTPTFLNDFGVPFLVPLARQPVSLQPLPLNLYELTSGDAMMLIDNEVEVTSGNKEEFY